MAGRRPARASRDRGQATVLLAGVVVVILLCAAGVAALGGRAVDRTRAQAAADAAALASVERGAGAAERVASSNGADLVSWNRDGLDVVVVVEIDGARATARASAAP